MKKMRILAFILSLLMVAALFAGCGKSEPNETTTASETTTTTSETTTTTTEEKIDLNGYVFTWVTGSSGAYSVYRPEPSDANSQAIKDACDEICAKYNFTFADVSIKSADLTTRIMQASFSGEKLGDFINANQDRWGNAALAGYLRPLNTDEVRACGMDVLDPNQFDVSMAKAATFGGNVYATQISGEYVPAQTGLTFAFNYNLVTAAGYAPASIYQSVREYTWTWDVFTDIARAGSVYNSEAGTYSVCGLSKMMVNAYLDSFAPVIAVKDGKYVSNLTSVSVVAGLNTLAKINSDPELIYTLPDGKTIGLSAGRKSFYDGISIFGMFDKMSDVSNNTSFEFGIIPIPRGSAATEYISPMFQCKLYFLQNANADWKTSCFILGELANLLNDPTKNCEIYKSQVRNDESLEMLQDYITPNARCTMVLFETSLSAAFDAVTADFTSGMNMVSIADKHNAVFEAAVAKAFKLFNK